MAAEASVYTQLKTERIHVGKPAAQALAAELDQIGAKRAFILSSGTLARQTDVIARMQDALGSRAVGLFSSFPAHGSRASVLAAAQAARDADADILIAVGGGSVIDPTKVVTLCLKHGLTKHEELDAYCNQLDANGRMVRPKFDGPDLRFIAVPTTLSGAEFNIGAGLTDERRHLKQGFGHALMAPRAIVLDPEITLHTPADLWISTGVRSIDHAVETLGSLRSNMFCDDLAASALATFADALPKSADDPHDLVQRQRCLVAVWQASLPLGAGVQMGISHATGHALGGTFGVPHGHTSCVTAPSALAFNLPFNAQRQVRISAALGHADVPASELLDQLIRRLGMPRSLTDVGLTPADLPRLAEAVMHDHWTRTNPRPIDSVDDVMAFLSSLPGAAS